MAVRFIPGDCLEEIPRLVAEGIVVDSIVTDPPYGLEFMGAEWDSFADKPKANWNKSRADHMSVVQTPGRFHGHTLPKSPIASSLLNSKCLACGKWKVDKDRCRCETPQFDLRFRKGAAPTVRAFQAFAEQWASRAFEILRPGGYLLAFGGSRTHHRIWSAIEDAGFVIQDTILDVVASDTRINAFMDSLSDEQRGAFAQAISEIPMLSWKYGSGFPKGRTQLKPAFEPICVAYKPGGKRTLQVDECRIATEGTPPSVLRRAQAEKSGRFGQIGDKHNGTLGKFRANGDRSEGLANYLANKEAEALGRWPANVCHDGSDVVMEAFAAFGESGNNSRVKKQGSVSPGWGGFRLRDISWNCGDAGTAARFFYCAKADGEDRWGSKHPTVKPVDLISWLVKLVTPPLGLVLDPFAGSGTTAVAAMATGRNAILIERDETYCADIKERIAHYDGEGRHSIVAKNRSRTNAGTPLPLFGVEADAPGKMRGDTCSDEHLI